MFGFGWKSGKAQLIDSAVVLVSIAVTPANPAVAKGLTKQFTATGTYSDGSTQPLTATAAWTSGTPAKATIDATGLATALAVGASVITAAVGLVSGNSTLTVAAAALVSIAVTPANANVNTGATQQMTATGTFTDGSTSNITASSGWTSGDVTKVTVGAATGLATGVAAGPSLITATKSTISGNTTLTDVVPPFDPATLNPDGWYAASYNNSGANHSWLPAPGVGTWSGAGNLSDQAGGVVAQTLGPNINGAGTAGAVNDGTKQLPSNNTFDTFIQADGNQGSVVIFFRTTAQGVAGANGTDDAGMLFDVGNSNICMAASASGVRGCANGFQNTPFIPLANNTYAMAALRWQGGNTSPGVMCRVSQPSGTVDQSHTMLTSFGLVGKVYSGSQHTAANGLVGDWEEILYFKRLLTDAELVSLKGYFNTKYNKGLT